MSERLSPIPTPASQLWRQLRLQYLPVVIYFAGLVGAYLLWTHWVAPPTLVGEAEAVRTELRAAQSGMLADLMRNASTPPPGRYTGDDVRAEMARLEETGP